jgi:hypothetical protein
MEPSLNPSIPQLIVYKALHREKIVTILSTIDKEMIGERRRRVNDERGTIYPPFQTYQKVI